MRLVKKTTKNGKQIKLKNYKQKARINRFKRRLFLVIIILATIGLILTHAPFMRVKTINCVGNQLIDSKEIIKVSNICKGNNLIRVNSKKAINNVKTLPYIKDVVIDKKLFSTITIRVEESTVASYIKEKDTYIYLDDKGKVLEISDVIPNNGAPVLDGIKVTKKDVNNVIELKNKKQVDAYSAFMNIVSGSVFYGKLTMVNLADINNIKFTVNNILEIIVGNTENLDYKINFLAKGAFENIGESRKGILDVSHGTSATFKEIY